MRTQDPETMTPAERDAEVASILARGLIRAVHAERSRSTRDISESGNLPPVDLNSRSMRTSVSPRGPGVRAPGRCEEESPCPT